MTLQSKALSVPLRDPRFDNDSGGKPTPFGRGYEPVANKQGYGSTTSFVPYPKNSIVLSRELGNTIG